MNQHFTITAFADEISKDLNEQIKVLLANGIHHMELRGINGKNVSDFTLDEAKQYHAQLQKAGIQVSSIGSPIGKIKITDDFAPHLEKFKHVLAIAAEFQAPYVRIFSFFLESDADAPKYRDEVMRRMQAFVDAAKVYPQITLLHENEKHIYGDQPKRCLDMLQTIDDPQLRAAFDPANFVQCQAKVYPEGYDMLRPYVVYMHIKDALYKDGEVRPAGYGDGHVQDVLTALADSDFNGFLSIEPHLSLFPGFEKLEAANDSGLKQADNVREFNVAAGALKKILTGLNEEWR